MRVTRRDVLVKRVAARGKKLFQSVLDFQRPDLLIFLLFLCNFHRSTGNIDLPWKWKRWEKCFVLHGAGKMLDQRCGGCGMERVGAGQWGRKRPRYGSMRTASCYQGYSCSRTGPSKGINPAEAPVSAPWREEEQEGHSQSPTKSPQTIYWCARFHTIRNRFCEGGLSTRSGLAAQHHAAQYARCQERWWTRQGH